MNNKHMISKIADKWLTPTEFSYFMQVNKYIYNIILPLYNIKKNDGSFLKLIREREYDTGTEINYECRISPNKKIQGLFKYWRKCNGDELYLEANILNDDIIGTVRIWYGRETSDCNNTDGLEKIWDKRGNLLAEINYEKGTQRQWYMNGQQYKDLNKVGKWINKEWFENGQISIEENVFNGKKDGLFRSWHQNGQLHQELNYSKGEEDGLFRSWYPNGQLSIYCNYSNGKLNGISRSWHSNGELSHEVIYINGEKEGIYRSWHPNGQLSIYRNYSNGQLNGIFKSYDERGELLNKINYINGNEKTLLYIIKNKIDKLWQ